MNEDEDKEATEKFIRSLPYILPTHKNWSSHADDFYHPLKAGSIDGTDLVAHDRGILRALNAEYKPNKKVVGDPSKTVMVRHLLKNITEVAVSDTFSKYGPLEKCRLIRDIVTGISRGYAFVEFKYVEDARRALQDCNIIQIDGNHVVVESELGRKLQGWIPRRFGGGLGGRKESGQLRFGGIERPFRRPIPQNSIQLGSNKSHGRNFSSKREHGSQQWSDNKRPCR